MPANLVPFPDRNLQDIPATLRRLANDIEAGNHGEVKNLEWVMEKWARL